MVNEDVSTWTFLITILNIMMAQLTSLATVYTS
jgi:hypothetical protein